MSMRIQEFLSNCCEGTKYYASEAASWIGKTVSPIGDMAAESTHKVMEFVKQNWESVKSWAQDNRQSLILAAIACAIGAIGTIIVYSVFARGTAAQPPVNGAPAVPPAVAGAGG